MGSDVFLHFHDRRPAGLDRGHARARLRRRRQGARRSCRSRRASGGPRSSRGSGPETPARPSAQRIEIHVDTRKLYFFDPATGESIAARRAAPAARRPASRPPDDAVARERGPEAAAHGGRREARRRRRRARRRRRHPPARSPRGSPGTSCRRADASDWPTTPTTSASAGAICERWLGSTTEADNRVGPARRGAELSRPRRTRRITLEGRGRGRPRSRSWARRTPRPTTGLGRLAKIFDYGTRLPLHLHQRQEHAALVGRRSKDEAYYFPPGVDMGAHPETFLGVHPSIAEERNHELLLPYLERWDSDLILQHSAATCRSAERGVPHPVGRAARAGDAR